MRRTWRNQDFEQCPDCFVVRLDPCGDECLPAIGEVDDVSGLADLEELLLPDRFYVMSDASSIYCDDTTGEGVDGFDTPEAAAEWARRQTIWRYGSELDFSDGVTSVIVLGARRTPPTPHGRSGRTRAADLTPRSASAIVRSTSAW